MDTWLAPLLPLYERARAAQRPLALAVVLRTAGSTYRKAGALMLIGRDGEHAGLLSGGCLEGDLAEHARSVIDSGAPRTVTYDLRSADDPLWGLGVGCEGAMDIFLLRIGPEDEWQPLAHFARALEAHRPAVAAIVVSCDAAPASLEGRWRPGQVLVAPSDLANIAHDAAEVSEPSWRQREGARLFVLPLGLPPRLLICGAGPDAMPVAELAVHLGWKVTLVDHRAAYAKPERFPAAARVLVIRPEEIAHALELEAFEAAVVMSHHLPSDLEHLRALAPCSIPYVGLLGPAARREKLLADLGDAGEPLRERLRAPVGLALGGRTPESIALAIVAEIHAFLHGGLGGPFSALAGRAAR